MHRREVGIQQDSSLSERTKKQIIEVTTLKTTFKEALGDGTDMIKSHLYVLHEGEAHCPKHGQALGELGTGSTNDDICIINCT